ncbi:MAG: SelB C-terminal domain-containing protein [Nannocystaceae bacterium]
MARVTRSLVVGTAGHIDHGKTSLTRALTGVDTDRLAEEKRRGITIELGFAAWPLASGIEASVVDVPGHEGLVRTMVAGAGGIDVVMLVISAEEGVMPQTREHLGICLLLGIRRAVVALTKIDRLGGDPEAIELAMDDVRSSLAGTAFADAPIVPCSAVTGEGLEALRVAVRRHADALPPRVVRDRPILPIDRVFTLKGHGTVITGTLLRGRLGAGGQGSWTLVPAGNRREPLEVRARGLQIRGAAADEARAGARVAVNLGGVATADLRRGDVLSAGDRVIRGAVVHALVESLSDRTGPSGAALRGPARPSWARGASVEVCAGTAHCVGVLDPLALVDDDGAWTPTRSIPPGSRALCRIRLRPSIPVWQGQRLILRRLHETRDPDGDTLGGGVVVDPAPSRGRGQRARWIVVAGALLGDDLEARVTALVDDAGALGIDLRALELRAGAIELAPVVDRLRDTGVIAALPGGRYVHEAAAAALVQAAIDAVQRAHEADPDAAGLGRATAIASLPGRVAPDVAALAVDRACERGDLCFFSEQGVLTRPGQGLARAGFPPALQAILARYVLADLAPPTIKEVSALAGVDERQALTAVSALQRAGALVRITPELSFAAESHQKVVALVRARLAAAGELDVQALKELTGLSRKFVVPLLEHLDRLQITRRQGDRRVAGARVHG